MGRLRRWVVLVPVVAAMTLPGGLWTAQAHGTGNPDGNNVEFGQIGVEDADTVRKVEPRKLTIQVGETVTFHVNGGHQVVILKPGVGLDALGAEGVNLDGTGPQTPLPPQVFPNAAPATTGLGPRFGPGRWDANPAATAAGIFCPAEPTNVAEAANIDRPQVFDKQDCATQAGVTTDFTTSAFTAPGRYAFFCNFPIHSWDEGIAVTGPGNVDLPVVVNGFGMHGFIYVE
jgi:plastocyanin